MDLEKLEVSEKKKFGSVSETIDLYFSKTKEAISRREFQKMLIDHYVGKPEPIVREIDHLYNSGLRQFLISDNLHEQKHSFANMPGMNQYSSSLQAMKPSEVGRIGRLLNDLKNFVYTYKDFEISKDQAKDCLGERRYSKYYYQKNQKHIDKAFYDSMHSRPDHFNNIHTEL